MAAVRQFTYRAIKNMKAKINPSQPKMFRKSQVDNHLTCPQARYKQTSRKSDNYSSSQSNIRRSSNTQPQSYAEAVGKKSGYSHQYSIPVNNRFDQLN